MNSTIQERPLLTVAGAAVRLNLSETSVRRRIASGELPAVQIGALIRIDQDALEAWLSNQRIAAKGAA